ncbi:MAG TPA: Na+/H+ antiporter NhaC [Gammaproteobacteria bacterium]|jgi:NhaC family Na+:H+ antiporter|nr:Na+/H+ antiporter NhaC [Gammaproteobacteria bacterium]|tara:strand:- start:1009 stop:2403 length:1395 start_codon:yes stop_codon:yes gene_type:complete
MEDSQDPSFLHSLICFGGVIVTVISGMLWLGISLHSLLVIAVVWVAGHSSWLGFSYQKIKSSMISGIEKGLGAIFIFFLIGILVAALIESGTIGGLIYYGLDLLHPTFFLPAGLVLCSLMSLATGTAWGTIATIGVVLMGLGSVLGIPLPIVVGMVVSGASFGDKMSPVSDTTNLAAMSADTDLYAHIKSMLYTTVPTYIISLIAFMLVGLYYTGQTLSAQEILTLSQHLEIEFAISPLTLLPLIVLLVLSLKRTPAEASMLASVATAVVLAVATQDRAITEVLNSLHTGYVADTGLEQLDTLLSRGGITSMMWTMSLALIALSLGGILDRAGFVRVLLRGMLKRIKRSASLMAATIGTGVVANMSMGEGYLSIIFGGQIFKESYEEDRLEKHMLSRCLEEGATLSTSLIPWTTSGAFITGALGMSPLEFAPWAFFNYINPLLSIGLAYMGFGIFRQTQLPATN